MKAALLTIYICFFPCSEGVGLAKDIARATSFARHDGLRIPLRAAELATNRDAKKRHAACDLPVIDGSAENFLEMFKANINAPMLITNMLHTWPAMEKWDEEWYKNADLPTAGVTDWNLSKKLFPERTVKTNIREYFTTFNVRANSSDPSVDPTDTEQVSLIESNAISFTSSQADGSCDVNRVSKDAHPHKDSIGLTNWDLVSEDAPLPDQLTDFCYNRHLAFGALYTSHGFHRHGAAWQASVKGYKSWYYLHRDTFVKPVDTTTRGTPFGFPHEEKLKETQSLCGYMPEDELVKENLKFCVQGPGEVMYTPDHWWHGTCALDEFTIATGGGLSLEAVKEADLVKNVDFKGYRPTANHVFTHEVERNKLSRKLFRIVDMDESNDIDVEEMQLSLQMALPGTPEALSLMMEAAGDDKRLDIEEFQHSITSLIQMFATNKVDDKVWEAFLDAINVVEVADLGDKAYLSMLQTSRKRDDSCTVAFFAEANCTGMAWGTYVLSAVDRDEQSIDSFHETNSYLVLGGSCGDVELWDDADEGACAVDNGWWDRETLGCNALVDFDLQDDISGLTIFREGGGRTAHCNAPLAL